MPDKEENKKDLLNTSPFNKIASSIKQNMDRLYQSTWFSTSLEKDSRESIVSNINGYIDNIMSNNLDISGVSNISNLYKRLKQTSDDPSTLTAFRNLFENKTLMNSIFSSYSQNRYLYDYDAEIDVVCKYMNKIEESLLVLKDNVLSTDHFSKDFISVINNSDNSDDELFSKRLDELKKTYNLLEKYEEYYYNASKYGEEFVYHVPYSKAISRIVKDRENLNITKANLNLEAGTFNGRQLPPKFDKVRNVTKTFGVLEVELCKSGVVSSIYESYEKDNRDRMLISEQSMETAFNENVMLFDEETPPKKRDDINDPISIDDTNVYKDRGQDSNILKVLGKLGKPYYKTKDGIIPNKDLDDYMDNYEKEASADDGLYDMNKRSGKKTKFDIPGCILNSLDRHNVIPIFINGEDICLGYYYFEFQEKRDFMINSSMRLSDPMMSVTNGNNFASENDQAEHDKALRYISSELSKYIDASFINRNQDLKKEIYAILKYNQIYNSSNPNKMRVTFIPPEDITHIYFELDPHTHRGRSDLHKAMLPAKLYTAMYITASIMIMTRGYDKRVYYVNPGIEANLTEALMNVINQVKQGNFGIRQIRNNLNQVLNITGRFNDYFILKNPNGDSPVNMEVIQGQNIDIKTDLMNMLEEMAINSTGVPIEIVQTRQNSMDYAIQLTMSNSKFLRLVFKRQAKANIFFSRITEKVYNYHFKKNDMLSFELPPPTFLSVTNNTQFFDNLNNYATHIVEMEWDGSQDDEVGKNWFMKEIKKDMAGTYYNKEYMQRVLKRAKHLAQIFPLPPKPPENG